MTENKTENNKMANYNDNECNERIIELENQLNKVMSERNDYRDRLFKERNSKAVVYMKPVISDKTPPRKNNKNTNSARKRRVRNQVSISSSDRSDDTDRDSAVYSPGSKATDIETSSQFSEKLTNKTVSSTSVQTNDTGENLEKTRNILLRAYLTNALEKLKSCEKERDDALQKLEETDVELSLEKSKNINLQDQIVSLTKDMENIKSCSKPKKNKCKKGFKKVQATKVILNETSTDSENDDYWSYDNTTSGLSLNCSENDELDDDFQIDNENSKLTDFIPKSEHIEKIAESNIKKIEAEEKLKNLENQVVELNKHLVRLSDQNLAEKVTNLDLTTKVVELKKVVKQQKQTIKQTLPSIPNQLIFHHQSQINNLALNAPPPPLPPAFFNPMIHYYNPANCYLPNYPINNLPKK